jgi:hypothetical protein
MQRLRIILEEYTFDINFIDCDEAFDSLNRQTRLKLLGHYMVAAKFCPHKQPV